MSGEDVKRNLRSRGVTLTAWALEHGFPYPIVSGVVRGVIKGNFGVAHDVAVALGMKTEEAES
ncbi:helix-turn-helix domain-containing protein [Herminiimonas arsenitoxidans]|uniref:hypothetical protein n=1 Tax=Herminiimonas arsenitoxidans TaxID=1809410 RepID=UPI0009713432|nr:hypothetical protein [Herminiimonas arsenitoxidans]